MKLLKQGIIIAALVTLAGLANAQLQFTGTRATEEGAIILNWQSESNAVYEIDYADQIVDAAVGATAWLPLYTEYPSHGTNTFVADAGSYDLNPGVPHPKLSPMRFYRVVYVESNTSASNPAVAITSPTNGATFSGDVTISVSASSDEILSDLRLYVNGEEQWSSDDGTNFLINTCEWPNGPHILFATAKSQSGFEGVANGDTITYGRSVSSYVNVTFANLITRLDLSQVFFQPALGQTQQVTAAFAAAANWTLQIQDTSSNTVRTATGSGGSMLFNWDGTGDGGVAISDGLYTYLVSAQTNGQPLLLQQPSGGDDSGSPPTPSLSSSLSASDSTSEVWYPTSARQAVKAGWNCYFSQPPPMPPVCTNGVWMNWEDVYGPIEPARIDLTDPTRQRLLRSLFSGAPSARSSIHTSSPDGVTAAYAGASSQSTRGPKRKPRVGVKGTLGSFGICYKTYGTNGFQSPHPRTGWPYPLPVYVALDGQSANAQTTDLRVGHFKQIAKDFAECMTKAGWTSRFSLADDQWGSADVKKPAKGGNSIFNTCNFGFLMTHGSYATTAASDNVKYTYLWLMTLSNNVTESVKLSDMDFGSSGTNGLKWMTILACNMLRADNITSMSRSELLPDNDNLHLLMGCSSTAYAAFNMGKYYASNLVASVAIPEAWYASAIKAYNENHTGMTNTVTFRTMGYNSCFSDKLLQWSDPDPNTAYNIQDRPVFTYP